jgi:hypothetical protein
MVVRSRKSAIVIGALLVAVAWAIRMPTLAHWASTGLMKPIALLLIFCAGLSMLVGALRVAQGKRGTVSFVLYLAFAGLACWSEHLRFLVPLAIGAVVAIGAIAWPASVPQSNQSGGKASTESV